MPRVLQIVPAGFHAADGPPLGLLHVAAAFVHARCDTRIVDCTVSPPPTLLPTLRDFRPHVVGIPLYTPMASTAYHLVRLIRDALPAPPLLLAGGPHATACPRECLARGFDLVALGEADETAADLAMALRQRRPPAGIDGLAYRTGAGEIYIPATVRIVSNLDALPSLASVRHLLPTSLCPRAPGYPLGLTTSRGCPGRCTFCANYVSGRRFRFFSAERVVAEIRACHDRGGRFVSFWDTAFTAHQPRARRLAGFLAAELPGIHFSASTRIDCVSPPTVRELKRAGLVALDFGLESGDDETLRAIHKRQTTAQARTALTITKEASIITCCNFILGFPHESAVQIENSLRFMRDIAPLTDVFSPHVTLVPWPGTAVYRRYHASCGFTDWWLRRDSPVAALTSRHRVNEEILQRNFFHHPPAVLDLIRSALDFIERHNARRIAPHLPVPA